MCDVVLNDLDDHDADDKDGDDSDNIGILDNGEDDDFSMRDTTTSSIPFKSAGVFNKEYKAMKGKPSY